MMTEATMAARTDQKWSAALIRRMARLADQEMSAAQIAKALGLTRGQVLGKMSRLGLKTKNLPRKGLTTALVEKLTKLIGQRLSANEIGQELGLTRPQVRYRMRHLGLKMNPKTEWPAGQAEKIPELISRGLSHGGIAKALGLTLGQVLGKMRVASASRRRTQPSSKKAVGGKWHTLNRRPDGMKNAASGCLQVLAARII
jgi:hypothetical protein